MQRKYENMRRLWKDEDNEDRKETTKMMGKRKKYRARRKRVSYYWFNFVFCGFISITCSSSLHSFDQKFDNRALVILPSEMSHWKQLSLDFMSDEESDDEEDPNGFVVHPLEWRSKR